jgi:hypothetical protein
LTLTKLKKNFKVASVVAIFSLYSLGLFLLGQKYDALDIGKNSNSPPEEIVERIQKPLPQDNSQSAQVLSSYVKLCANTTSSFQLSYPKDWFTTYNQKEEECKFFAPYSFVLPASPDDDFTPITIKFIDKDAWEQTLKDLQNPSELFNIISTKNLEVNGKPIKYIEAQSTGSLKPKGFVRVTYLIFDSAKPVEISYNQLNEKEDIKTAEDVLKSLVDSFKYF